jgi:antitoxin ParD1/3/4
MAVLNISDQDLAFIQEQAKGASQTPDQYVAALVRAEHRRRALADLEAKLLEGVESGPATEMTQADWEELRRQVREQATAHGQR